MTTDGFTFAEIHGEIEVPAPADALEFAYVIDGRLDVEFGGTAHHLTAGMCVLLPHGVPRTIRTTAGAHALHLTAPGEATVEHGYVLARGETRPGRVPLPPAFGVKARTTDTGGRFSLLEVTVAQPIPRHTHHGADERIHVLDGALEIDFGDTTRTVGKGEFVLLPHGRPHAIRPASAPPPRVIQVSSPGGWEYVVEALIENRTEVSRGGRFDPAALNRYTRRHGVTYEVAGG